MDIPFLISSFVFVGVVVGLVRWFGRVQFGSSRENILKQHEDISRMLRLDYIKEGCDAGLTSTET